MASDEALDPLVENRPPWWKVGLATLAGVVAGGLVFPIVQWPITILVDQLFGRSGWQEVLAAWPQSFRIALLILYWAIPLTLGQFFSSLMSGWSRTVYFAAALQTLHLINIYGNFAFSALWLLPLVVSAAMMMTKWAAAGAEKGRAVEASKVAARGKH